MLRPRPIGRGLRQRLAAGGSRAGGRPAATPREWAIIRTAVVIRAHYRCQACGARRPLDVHHVVKRSQGGSDVDLNGLVALCRRCHAWTDAPYRQGRLVITPQSDGTIGVARVWRASKWATGGEVRTPWPRGVLEDRRPPGTREAHADGRRCYLRHGPEEVIIHDQATLDAATARRVVEGVLGTDRVPPSAPRETPGAKSQVIPILRRLWVGRDVDDGQTYVVVLVNDRCVVRPPSARPSEAAGIESL